MRHTVSTLARGQVAGRAGGWSQLAAAGPLATGQCLALRNSFPPSPAAPTGVTFSERFVKLVRCGTPQHGLSSKNMALITSDYGIMCSLSIK